MLLSFFADALTNYGGVTGSVSFAYTPTTLSSPRTCPSEGGSSTVGGVNGGWGSVAGVSHWWFSGKYSNKMCQTTFTAGEGMILVVSVLSWNVRAGDVLGLYDGPSMGGYPALISNASTLPTGNTTALYSSGNSVTVFYSTGSSPLSGVSLAITPQALDSLFPNTSICTRLISSFAVTLASTALNHTLRTSPGGSYGNSVGCAFTVTGPWDTLLTLAFTSFQTELSLDVWSVYDGVSSAYPLLAAYSGLYSTSSPPAPLTSTSNSMHITFSSSPSAAYSGVVAYVQARAQTPTYCDSASSLSPLAAYAISTAGYIANQISGVSCAFRITAPKGYAVVLTYASSRLSTGDAWEVYDGFSPSSANLMYTVTYSGSLPSVVTSTGPQLFVLFTAGTPAVKVSFALASRCTTLSKAPSGSSFLGIAASPAGCGINERRLLGGRGGGGDLEEVSSTSGFMGGVAPCHVDTPRDECLVPSNYLKQQ